MKTENLQLGNNKSAEKEIEARLDNIVQALLLILQLL